MSHSASKVSRQQQLAVRWGQLDLQRFSAWRQLVSWLLQQPILACRHVSQSICSSGLLRLNMLLRPASI